MPDNSTLLVELELHLDRAREIIALLAGRRVNAELNRNWSFDAVTWMLVSPFGVALKLHESEAAVMNVFVASHDRRGTYAELLSAIGDNGSRGRNHLAILLSRLRARGRRVGVVIPITAERARGHIFLEPLNKSGA